MNTPISPVYEADIITVSDRYHIGISGNLTGRSIWCEHPRESMLVRDSTREGLIGFRLERFLHRCLRIRGSVIRSDRSNLFMLCGGMRKGCCMHE